MLISILDLEHVTVNDIMVPRNEITGIDINDDWKSIVRQLTHSAHGRVVLYRDQIDEVVGMLRLRKAYRLMLEKMNLIKKHYYVLPMKFISFQKQHRLTFSY